MSSIIESDNIGDLLKFEIDKNYSREVVTVASGQKLKMGTVVGIKSDSGEAKIVSIAEEETDGSDKAFGILLSDVDAIDGSKQAVVLARGGIVITQSVVYPESASETAIAKVNVALESRGIVLR